MRRATSAAAALPAREAGPESGVLASDDLELLAELATGATLAVIARKRGMSPRQMRRIIQDICDQLDVDQPIQAVVWAVRLQLI